ncbi:MAG: Hpt domain-containing protein [Rhodospirillales bacterium]|nr:Hpt domain-containing protein [Rhodospirillales bacterium]
MSDLIDVAVVEQLKGFIQDKFAGVVEVFINNSDKYIEAIQRGVKAGDAQTVADAAHPLKSSSANLGLVKLSEICRALEAGANDVLAGTETLEVLAVKQEGIDAVYADSIALLKQQI